MDLAQELDPYFLMYEPRKHSMVEILGGILWILVSGAQWCLLPREIFPPKSTCYYWFNKFRKDRVLDMIMNKLNISDLKIIDEAYIDATFTEAKQGGLKVGGTKAGKGSKIFAVISKEKKFFIFQSKMRAHTKLCLFQVLSLISIRRQKF